MKERKMASVFHRAAQYLSLFENAFKTFFFPCPPEAFVPAITNSPSIFRGNSKSLSLTELLKDSILWAVPKKRRSLQKRRSRRFGYPDKVYKILMPKNNILVCTKCGSYHESGLLCPVCYRKVKEETTEMQDAINAALGISPVENEVVVLYSGEKASDSEFYKGKRIVEMKKERPKIFSNNLLQKSTQGESETKEVVVPK